MELLNQTAAFFAGLPCDIGWAIDPNLKAQSLGPCEEAQVVANAVPKRQREFRSGRNMARAALARIGHPTEQLLPARNRAPQWPDATCGSISHCDTLSIAVASTDLDGIGVDVEPLHALSEGVARLVLTDSDRAAQPTDQPHWPLMVFCAKEAFYKATSEQLTYVPDFQEISVRAKTNGTFEFFGASRQLVQSLAADAISGHWAALEGYVLALVTRSAQVSKNASSSSICASPSRMT
jgi:4'-phosphopantetheinyl transferase EntD